MCLSLTSSLQCKAQPSGAFFPESYFAEIAGIVVGVFLYLVERDRRRLPRCARHILRRQCENEGSGIRRSGAIDEAQLAAYVALYIEQSEPLRHLVLRQKSIYAPVHLRDGVENGAQLPQPEYFIQLS
jgi:hypothetical protein